MKLRAYLDGLKCLKCGICGVHLNRLELVHHRTLHTDAERLGLKNEWEEEVRDAYKIRG